jgi:hypothetical protein
MAIPESHHPDVAILNQIRELASGMSDQRSKAILGSVIDAVALNPQPLPPRVHEILKSVLEAVALNPQPLPPDPPPESGRPA